MAVLLTLVMLTWGVNIPTVKILTGVMDVAWVGALRMVEATVVLTLLLWWRDRRWPRLAARQWWALAQIAFLLVYLYQLLFTQGARLSTATNTSLVLALMPLLSVVGGSWAFGERISARTLVGLAMGFAGVALVVLQSPAAQVGVAGLGELTVLAALVSFIAGGLLIQRVTRELDVFVMGWAVYVIGTGMLLTHAMAGGGARVALQSLEGPWIGLCLLYSGICGTALANAGWFRAIERVGQSRASPYLNLTPIFGVIASAVLLREPLGWWHGAGLLLVIGGTRVGAMQRKALAAG